MGSVSRRLTALAFVAASCICPVAGAADGGIYLFLQPLPVEAARLTFTIASISAFTTAGPESALKVHLTTVGAAQAGRQRLLASARLPFGTYAGFSFRVSRAALNDGGGGGELRVPDAAVPVNATFVAGPQPTIIWLTLRYPDSVTGGIGFNPTFSIEAPPRPIAERLGFVSNAGSGTITVFDKNLAQVVAVIDACAGASGMALDQQRRRLYVACAKEDEVQCIDVASGEVVERSRLSPGDRPREIALTPDGATLVSVNSGSGSISFFDALSLFRRERVSVGSGPASLVIDASGRRAFVLNALSSSLSVVDIANRSVVGTVSMEAAPLRAALSERAGRLYVIHERSPYMTVLDSRQLTIVTRARLRIGVTAIVIDTVRDLLCIGGDDTMVEFYDPNALLPLYSTRIKGGVSFLAFDAPDNNLYALSDDARTVSTVRLSTRKVASQIDVGDGPYAVAVMGER
jgi:YVTN family beta-propeller protein